MSFPTHYRLAFLCICLLRSEPNLIHPPRPQITKTQIWSIVTSTPPPKYPLTSENFLETSLASDGLSSALSLPLVWQFFIEIWTTSVSHSPAHISQTQIWPDSDVINSHLPDAHRHPKTWWKRAQLVMVFPTNYRLWYYKHFSFKCMSIFENDRWS